MISLRAFASISSLFTLFLSSMKRRTWILNVNWMFCAFFCSLSHSTTEWTTESSFHSYRPLSVANIPIWVYYFFEWSLASARSFLLLLLLSRPRVCVCVSVVVWVLLHVTDDSNLETSIFASSAHSTDSTVHRVVRWCFSIFLCCDFCSKILVLTATQRQQQQHVFFCGSVWLCIKCSSDVGANALSIQGKTHCIYRKLYRRGVDTRTLSGSVLTNHYIIRDNHMDCGWR